jgi:ribonucleoside-diphosphate reductase alpha chain
MCGTGVGFSVERRNIQKLPTVAEEICDTESVLKIGDSKKGWAIGFKQLVAMLYAGEAPQWDLSAVRPAGARLKTFGGRASGPQPLDDLFKFTVALFKQAVGRQLNDIECHDLCCKIAEIVVVGGVRRSALISLSNLGSNRMRHAKDGEFWKKAPQRSLANNSVAYTEKPDLETFMEEWLSLYRSESGERGIFNRAAADHQVDRSGRRETGHEWGTNPCSEIILRPNQFCNLSEVVVRDGDDLATLERKVRVATLLGTLQSTLTNFKVLRKIWERNTSEERLLGVSLTGIADHSVLGNPKDKSLPATLEMLKAVAIAANEEYAKSLGIPRSSAITCVKPSGTVSQLVNSASGIHARHAPYYIRRVRGDKKDPLTQYMIEAGFPYEEDAYNPQTVVFDFPIKAPNTAKQYGAMEHLELWKIYQDNWCDHKPSITVSYNDDEFIAAGNWVWENFNKISGISFLPRFDHVYAQAPYEEFTEAEYHALVARMPAVDFTGFKEDSDQTTASQELACVGNVCEIVDVS